MTGLALRRVRTLLTLLALVVIVVVGVRLGWSKLTQPYPSLQSATKSGCVQRDVAAGDRVSPAEVTVSVLNAGKREGLAGATLADLTDDGFVRGTLDNAPTGARVRTVEIWTTDPRNPAVRLLRGYLGKSVTIHDGDAGAPGVDVVVGDKFVGVVKGRNGVRSREDTQVCGP